MTTRTKFTCISHKTKIKNQIPLHKQRKNNVSVEQRRDHVVQRAATLDGLVDGGGKPPESHCHRHYFSLPFSSVISLSLEVRKRHAQGRRYAQCGSGLCVSRFGYGLFWGWDFGWWQKIRQYFWFLFVANNTNMIFVLLFFLMFSDNLSYS